MAQPGDTVAFRIEDIYLPGPEETLLTLGGRERMLGVLSSITVAASGTENFGVIELESGAKVIVPVNRLIPIVIGRKGEDDAD